VNTKTYSSEFSPLSLRISNNTLLADYRYTLYKRPLVETRSVEDQIESFVEEVIGEGAKVIGYFYARGVYTFLIQTPVDHQSH